MSLAVDDALEAEAVQRDHAVALQPAVADRLKVRYHRGVEVPHNLVVAGHAHTAIQRGRGPFRAAQLADGLQLSDIADLVETVAAGIEDKLAGVVRRGVMSIRQAIAVTVGIRRARERCADGIVDVPR